MVVARVKRSPASVCMWFCLSVCLFVCLFVRMIKPKRLKLHHQTCHGDCSPTSWVLNTHLILGQNIKCEGHRVTKYKNIEGDRVAGVSLHLTYNPNPIIIRRSIEMHPLVLVMIAYLMPSKRLTGGLYFCLLLLLLTAISDGCDGTDWWRFYCYAVQSKRHRYYLIRLGLPLAQSAGYESYRFRSAIANVRGTHAEQYAQ